MNRTHSLFILLISHLVINSNTFFLSWRDYRALFRILPRFTDPGYRRSSTEPTKNSKFLGEPKTPGYIHKEHRNSAADHHHHHHSHPHEDYEINKEFRENYKKYEKYEKDHPKVYSSKSKASYEKYDGHSNCGHHHHHHHHGHHDLEDNDHKNFIDHKSYHERGSHRPYDQHHYDEHKNHHHHDHHHGHHHDDHYHEYHGDGHFHAPVRHDDHRLRGDIKHEQLSKSKFEFYEDENRSKKHSYLEKDEHDSTDYFDRLYSKNEGLDQAIKDELDRKVIKDYVSGVLVLVPPNQQKLNGHSLEKTVNEQVDTKSDDLAGNEEDYSKVLREYLLRSYSQ